MMMIFLETLLLKKDGILPSVCKAPQMDFWITGPPPSFYEAPAYETTK
jgi:hypothetical protein